MPRLRNKALVKHNLDLWLNDLLLRDGFFTNVTYGETDIYSRDISQLTLVSDPSFIDGTVWQSAFKNWVHESGIIPTETGVAPPLLASGVTVNGTFYPYDNAAVGYDASYAHFIDWPNGRVIFTNALTSSDVVQGQFAYKEIGVEYSNAFENESKEFYVETMYKDNPYQSGVITYPQENDRTLPMVFIDVDQVDYDAYELGNASNVATMRGSFIIWSRDSYTVDLLDDLLGYQEHTVLLGIDFNQPGGCPFPLQAFGSKNLAFTSYGSTASLGSPYFWRRIYLDNVSSRKLPPYYNIDRSRVDFLIRVYPNF